MEYVLRLIGVERVYENGIVANRDINLDIRKGEIHAIVGENGAGKSTLMKMIYGMEKPDAGKIVVKGKEVRFSSSMDAIKMNIGMVHQHFMLVDSLTVAENLILNVPKRPFIKRSEINKLTREMCEKYGFNLDGDAVVRDLSVGNRQQLEILKALYRGAEILILDEPTAVLTPQETEKLFAQLIRLKEIGRTILFISHKINEVMEISDRISVLRQGSLAGTFETSEVDGRKLSNLIVGREFSEKICKPPKKVGGDLLVVKGLSYIDPLKKKVIENVDFSVAKGEIVGLCGVEGNGQSDVVAAVSGELRSYGGEIFLGGVNLKGITKRKFRALGAAHIPRDRLADGLCADSSVKENLISTLYINKKFVKGKYFLDKKAITAFADKQIAEYDIKTNDGDELAGMLSGGNMQKVVAAREFADNPIFAVVDQPTRGVDIGASKIIRDKIVELRNDGCAVLLNSADLSELLSICDRILVFYNGSIAARFDEPSEIDENTLGKYMLGIENMYRKNENEKTAV